MGDERFLCSYRIGEPKLPLRKMISREELLNIIQRIEQRSASEEDLRIYNAWCNAQQQDGKPVPGDLGTLQHQLLDRINRQIDKKSRTLKLWVRIAAALILVAGLSALLISIPFHSGRSGLATRPPVKQDVAPGTNRATLILANGRQVVLDAANREALAATSGTMTFNVTDSMLVYHEPEAGDKPADPGRMAWHTLITARAQQYQLVLPDGSRIWLNAATRVRFPLRFSGQKERRVELEGEAYFEIAKDASKPFIVHSNRQDIRVLGTHFNVSSYADEAEAKTTLLEGSVRVNGKLTLKPGEQLKTDGKGKQAISKVNTAASVAWQKGYFEFNDENIYEIMSKVARWYDVTVIYEGTIPLDKMKGSMSRFQNVSGVLSILEATGLLSFRIDGKKIYVAGGG